MGLIIDYCDLNIDKGIVEILDIIDGTYGEWGVDTASIYNESLYMSTGIASIEDDLIQFARSGVTGSVALHVETEEVPRAIEFYVLQLGKAYKYSYDIDIDYDSIFEQVLRSINHTTGEPGGLITILTSE
jgi:hypothetical protein